ncbi:MAG: GGDEF domain-containing protein [Chryseobacterium sp.]|uniref:GGDEF domain-containing protein n=1 Tax=Chryseobacterium sp. TaxID=1871047 RepID=UPI0025C2F306|nr:GGDEF domain-containing protein [Chryseobacterium sp.]MCJ7933334.1 GGDEF domain-containing protein [Chryseobacterium sp.]
MKYLIESFNKFRKDALSKIIYDILIYIVTGIIFIQILKYIPIVKDFFLEKIEISIWLFISIILVSILLIFILYYIRFNRVVKKIKEQNQTDELTSLKNHKALDETLDLIFKNKTNKPISFILIDIDNFKKFNDEYGYDIADLIMNKLGDLLKRDSRITDDVFRYFFRGDEFLIIAHETNISNAKIAAERKKQLISDANFNIKEKNHKLTICCGVTELQPNDNIETLKVRLNQALLQAKKNPTKNKVEIVI